MVKRGSISFVIFCIVLFTLMPIESAIVFAEISDTATGYGGTDDAGSNGLTGPITTGAGSQSSGSSSLSVHLPEYASSSNFQFSGNASPNAIVDVYTNGRLFHSTLADANGTFSFRRILLEPDIPNTIRVVARLDPNSPPTEVSSIVNVDDVFPAFLNITQIPDTLKEQTFRLSGSLSEPGRVIVTITNSDTDETSTQVVTANSATFTSDLSLEEGISEIIVKAYDKADNSIEKNFMTNVDTTDPEFLNDNLDELSPSYSREITVKGQISEPARIRIIVNGKGKSHYECSDGIDNDEDGDTDYPFDPGCDSPVDIFEYQSKYNYKCSNNLDDDRDGFADFPDDVGCDNSRDNDEVNFNATSVCNDDKDNDGDGKIDFNPKSNGDWGCTSLNDKDEGDDPNIGLVYTTETDEEGKFSKKVNLDFTLQSGSAPLVGNTMNSVRSDAGGKIKLEFGTSKVSNDIEVVAIDQVGRTADISGNVDYASCSSGQGEMVIYQNEVYPASLLPDLIFQGIAQINFAFELEYFGSATEYSVDSVSVGTRDLSVEDKDNWGVDGANLLDPARCVAMSDVSGGRGNKWYVTCTLKRWPTSAYRNITAAYEQFEKQEVLKLPIELHVDYTEYYPEPGQEPRPEQKTQIVCYDMEYLLDLRSDPDNIPRDLLEDSVKVLTEVIDAIDTILPYVTQAKWIVAIGCFGMFIVNFVSNIGETSACWEVKDVEPYLETYIRGSKGF